MFKEQYKHMINQVKVSGELINHVSNNTHNNMNFKNTKLTLYRKPIIFITSICISILLAFPLLTLALTVEPVYQMMYNFVPSVAQFFTIIEKSDEDNGIKMEVISTYIHDNIAEIFITIQDLTGDRVDKTIDLYDSYSINRPFDSVAHCENVGYDETTKTATFLITIEAWSDTKIAGDKVTFSVKEMLSHKKKYEGIVIPIDLSTVPPTASNTQEVHLSGYGGMDSDEFFTENTTTALVSSKPIKEFSVDGIELTGIGYIDGKLHIQTTVHNQIENDNHGFFYLSNTKNDEILFDYNFYFLKESELQQRVDYCEYIFDIPQSEIQQYALYGNFITSGMNIKGNWSVTFPLEQSQE